MPWQLASRYRMRAMTRSGLDAWFVGLSVNDVGAQWRGWRARHGVRPDELITKGLVYCGRERIGTMSFNGQFSPSERKGR